MRGSLVVFDAENFLVCPVSRGVLRSMSRVRPRLGMAIARYPIE